jgi:DNA repair ATPase/pyridine nucleotide-disulfide oxidoreductase
MTEETISDIQQTVTEGEAFEVIRKRLDQQGLALQAKIDRLNTLRAEEFGQTELKIIGRVRARTENNCVPRDIVRVGKHLMLFGYNVFIGMKKETRVEDVFSLYNLVETEDGFDLEAHASPGLSRRDALKLMGISPFAASLLAGSATEAKASSDAKGKIVILGGGAGGIMAMAHLRSALSNPDITIVAPNEIHLYQSGQVFIAAGEYELSDIEMSNKDFIPDDVKWIKDEAKSIDPDKNTLTLRSGEELAYDYLVVATGIQYHYDQIEGFTKEDIGKNGISSVYFNDLEKGIYVGGELIH